MNYRKILEEKLVPLYGTARLPQGMEVYPGLRNVISFALPLPRTIIEGIRRHGPDKVYFHHYRTCNAYIDHVSFTLVLALEREGYGAVYVPASQSVSDDGLSGMLSHKAAAVLCGLGGIGQNDLLVTREYGCGVRLGTVMTDYPVEESGIIQNPCTNCGNCVKQCPSGALAGTEWSINTPLCDIIDAEKCSRYMKRAFQKIGWGAVCGICMAACPVGNNRK